MRLRGNEMPDRALSTNGTCPLPPSLVPAALDPLIRLRREARHGADWRRCVIRLRLSTGWWLEFLPWMP